MRLKKKTTLIMSIAAILMTLILLISSYQLFKYILFTSIQPSAMSTADLVRNNHTMAMDLENPPDHDEFLNSIKAKAGIHDLWIQRSESVIRQYGLSHSQQHEMTDRERDVFKSGKPVFDVYGYGKDAHFVTTIPYIASSSGKQDCLACHDVAEGTVLGTVTLEVSLKDQWQTAIVSGLTIALVMLLISLVTILYFRRVLTPYETTVDEIEAVMNKAHVGDFSYTITQSSDDDVGKIAKMLNQLLTLVNSEVISLSSKVADLLHYKAPLGNNRLLSMTELVENLVDASIFKQTIEEDETRSEVYARLAKIVHSHFDIKQFSLYEIDNIKNRMIPVFIDGEACKECLWCNPEILVRNTACRACRTGHIVDSIESPGICSFFNPPQGQTDLAHVCIPVNQSGSIGNVLQLVVNRDEAELTELYIPFILQYLREAAPVIESKRLMDTLRESSLTDAMTGLHNRRFLEEFSQNLVAYTERNKASFSILMADLDYFKKVNDTYGHEVGDTVLKELAKVLRNSVRTSDLVIRYGGEEFLIILRDTEGEVADQVAEKIRASVEAMKVQVSGAIIKKTLSLGVATFPSDSDSFWQVIKYADVALYQAKETGRNKILHFAPEMWTDDQHF